jgi:hypothetical protein
MPIEYAIDHQRRLVTATGRGTLTDRDVFGYQRQVWSQPAVSGYNELVDMSAVEHIALESISRVVQLARTSAGMDPSSRWSKFAIVAPKDVAFGLGRMYQSYRSQEEHSTKEVGVFRSLPEALKFLGIESPGT